MLVALAALALSAMSGKAQPSSLTIAVMSAQVIVTPPVAASTCATSTTFTYSGTVTDTGPGKLSYQWLYSSGKQGPVQTLSFTAPGHRWVSGRASSRPTRRAQDGAEIKVLSATAKTSNKATYRLLCSTTANSGIALSASVQPTAQTVYSRMCGSGAMQVSPSARSRPRRAESVRPYWALADGQHSGASTVTFKAPGTKTLPPLTITPPALPASGEAVLVVTKPVTAASKPATYTVSCVAAATATARRWCRRRRRRRLGPEFREIAAEPRQDECEADAHCTKPSPTKAAPTSTSAYHGRAYHPSADHRAVPTTPVPTTPVPTTPVPTTPVPTTPIPSES